MKKKITAALLCAVMVLSLAGCNGNNEEPDDDDDKPKKDKSSYSESVKSSDESKPEDSSSTESKPTESEPTESSSTKSSKGSSTESKPEEKPQSIDPIDWSTVPYADELDFMVEEVEGGVRITEYRGEEKILKIPETINGKTVVSLGYFLPYGATGLSIPNSVTKIPETFFYCRELQSIVLPNNYATDTNPEFLKDCKEGKTVLTFLGNTYQMPEDYIKLQDALYPGTGNMLIKDGVLLKVSIAIKDVEIPDNVTSIKWGAFSNCDLIEDITIPGKITEIDMARNHNPNAFFYFCRNLKSVTFAEGVTKINAILFNGCPKLETITLPDSLTYLVGGSLDAIPKQAQVTYKGVTYKSNQLQDLYKAVNGN